MKPPRPATATPIGSAAAASRRTVDVVFHATRTVDVLPGQPTPKADRTTYTIVCQDLTAVISKDLELDIQRKVVAQLAHELRNKTTPAATLLERVQTLADDTTTDDAAVRAELTLLAPDASAAAALLAEADQVIETRLVIHKVYAGTYASTVETVDLREAMRARVEAAAATAAKGVTFRVEMLLLPRLLLNRPHGAETADDDPADDAPTVWARLDTYMFRHLANNFLSNARKAVDAGEVVFALLGASSSSSAEGSAASVLTFAVRDTGRGIPASTAAKLFTEEVASGDVRGVGLGLVSCKRFAEAVGGRCWLHATRAVTPEAPTGGSEFRFELPGRLIDEDATTLTGPGVVVATAEEEEDHPSSSSTTPCWTTTAEDHQAWCSARRRAHHHDDDAAEGRPQNGGPVPAAPRRPPSGDDDEPGLLFPRELRVFIVEDSALIRRSITAKLEQIRARLAKEHREAPTTRLRVREFATCEALLASALDDVLDAGPSGLVTVDQNLESAGGNLLGSDLIRTLAARRFAGLVVSVSGDADTEELHRSLGAHLVLGKPLPRTDRIFDALAAEYRRRRGAYKSDVGTSAS